MRAFIVLLALGLFTLVACGGQPTQPVVQPTVVEPTATPTIAPTPTPQPTATPAPLTPVEIFEQMSPAVIRIESESGFGSGVLIDDGYVLTNAHVVWPAKDVILSLTDGTALEAIPVAAVDLLADLALLGPIETQIEPLTLGDAEALEIGSTLLLIGYPGDAARSPQLTLTETLVSRLREHEAFDMTYFQVSAPVAGGQSGGIAVTMDGEVVGLTGNRITEAQYGLVASAADIAPRIEAMLDGPPEERLPRGTDESQADTRHFFTLRDEQDSRAFVAHLPAETDLEVSVDSDGDAVLFIVGPTEEDFLAADATTRGQEKAQHTTSTSGTYYAVVGQYGSGGGAFELESNVEWLPYNDPDDGTVLAIGKSYAGLMDYPSDVDIMNLVLVEDQVVNINVSSVLMDPSVLIESSVIEGGSLVKDDNSGGGLFESDAEFTFIAPHSGLFRVIVLDTTGFTRGGYLIQVRDLYPGAPTPTAPEPTPTPISSPFGELVRYESAVFPFAFSYPKSLRDVSKTSGCPETMYSACYTDALNQNFIGVVEAEMGRPGQAQTLDEWAQMIEENLGGSMNLTLVSREDIESARNAPATVLSLVNEEQGMHVKIFGYILDQDAIINIVYISFDSAQEELMDYVFTTFEVTE